MNALRAGLASFLVLGLLAGQQMQAAEVAEPRATALAIPATWYDLSTRAAAVNAWNDFAPTRTAPMGFTGNVGSRVAGTTSTAYKSAVAQRVNWFRAMAGVTGSITLDATQNGAAQEGALMLAVQGRSIPLVTNNPADYPYFNQSGLNALLNSMTCRGVTPDPGCIEQYMHEAGNSAEYWSAGHRRYILFPQATTMATGDVPVTGTGDVPAGTGFYNALEVAGFPTNPNRTARDNFVAWPPKGYVPYQVVYPRWSFSYPNADFSQASVTMSVGGSPVTITMDPPGIQTGENTIVWKPAGFTDNPGAPASDTTYTVNVNNVLINGGRQNFSYQVSVIDPAAGAGNCTFALSSNVLTASSLYTSATLNLTASGANCAWSASSNKPWAQVFPLSGTGSGTIYYTIYPNYSTQTRNAALTIGGQNLSITQPPTPGTPDERFVGQLYFNYFGRVPLPSEVQFQIQNGLQQGVSKAQLAANFLNSQEFNDAGRFVAGNYVGILARDAEYSGWLFQRNAMATAGLTPQTLVNNFLNSAEFINRNGTLTNDQFVTLMYQQILGRSPSPSEIAFQVNALQTTGLTRVGLVVNFLLSPEFRTGTQSRLNAFLLYATLLNRDPNSAELQSTAAALNTQPAVNVMAPIIASPEFAAILQ